MEITSVNNENQPEIDEIEKILLTFDKDKALRREKLNKYVPELAKFSKNELERKKVDTEHSVAHASTGTPFFMSLVPLTVGCFIPEYLRLAVCIYPVIYIFLSEDGNKRNNRLCALKMALIEK